MMANEDKKDFNAMLRDGKGMPRIQEITDGSSIEKYGGSRMLLAPPLDYDGLMRKIPAGRIATVGDLRKTLSKRYGADFTDPITAGIFCSIAAWASAQRTEDETPWWRTLKAQGELNAKYPGGIEKQKALLESEGHTVLVRGRANKRYFVKDYESKRFPLEEEKP